MFENQVKQFTSYLPALTKKDDFHRFWEKTLKESAKIPLNSVLEEINYPIKQIEAFTIFYQGFGGSPINGYYILPKERSGSVPCIIFYHGYCGEKGSISNYMKWVIQGYAVLQLATIFGRRRGENKGPI